VSAPRPGFAGRHVHSTANPAGFIAAPVTNAAYAAHEYTRIAANRVVEFGGFGEGLIGRS